jgi:hypothetical protein
LHLILTIFILVTFFTNILGFIDLLTQVPDGCPDEAEIEIGTEPNLLWLCRGLNPGAPACKPRLKILELCKLSTFYFPYDM